MKERVEIYTGMIKREHPVFEVIDVSHTRARVAVPLQL